MSAHNITISDELKYILSENDTLETLYIKAQIILLFMKLLNILVKSCMLYCIYNIILRSSIKELPKIKYTQFYTMILSMYMVQYTFTGTSSL